MRDQRAELTEKQTEVLEAVRAHKREEGKPPSRRDLARRTGQKHETSVENHLRALEHKGYIRAGRGKMRNILVLDDIMPIVEPTGPVPSHEPIPIQPQNAETLLADIADRMPRRPDCYLTVTGNSMSTAGIRDGDLVALQLSGDVPEDGAIVLVRIVDSVTLRRLHRIDAETVELRPESEEPGHVTQVVNTNEETLRIDGEVVGLVTMEAPTAPENK